MKHNKVMIGIAATLLIMSCHVKNNKVEKIEFSKTPTRVETTVIEKNSNTIILNYSGLITPLVSTKLGFQIPGIINKIYVEEGDKVIKGQVLAELKKTSYKSSYNAALAIKTQAQDAYDRLKSVYDKGSLPDIEWENVKSKLEQANSAEQIARNNLDNCHLTAPSDGVIGSRNMEIGTSVIPGISVLELVSINDVYVKISVPENEINKIKKGQKAFVVIPAINRKTIEGKVDKIGVLANPISKTYEVKIRVKNQGLKIKPGMVCDVNLNIKNEEKMITVPSRAVLRDTDNSNYVFLIDPNSGKAKKQEVIIGEFLNNNLRVLSGLEEGDIIVINGQHKLSTNSNVVF